MTRETKIGLLVGLAFIIVIGILLSDHLSVSAEPPRAALVQAGKSVRDGIAAPGTPTASIPTPPPADPTPQRPVPTRDDLLPPVQRQDAIVSIQTGGHPQYRPPITIQHHAPDASYAPQGNYADQPSAYHRLPDETIAGSIPPAPSVDLPAPVDGGMSRDHATIARDNPLAQLAEQFGEQVVSLDRPARPARQGETLEAREYVATSGDSLSKIAARFYGRSTKESRELILRANPSLKGNPDLIVAGRTYLIPQKGLTVTPAPVAVRAAGRSTPVETYTVKEGDTLWKIAKDQCGSVRQLQSIRDLNKDVLKGGDTVIVGMNLRLPTRPLASIQ